VSTRGVFGGFLAFALLVVRPNVLEQDEGLRLRLVDGFLGHHEMSGSEAAIGETEDEGSRFFGAQ